MSGCRIVRVNCRVVDRHRHFKVFRDALIPVRAGWEPYSTRGVRAMLARYAAEAGLQHNMPPHRLRHSLFTWLKSQGIDDALIQPYSGHASRTPLEIYSKIALGPAQETYDSVIDQFPV
ncbi:tyrosine-type recombinase/integrase [Streptosporangium roseum]|uniref:tyrosine-type recombinase/integrase n=1 Tax=Streptosporangium roseum TaxID=2001 RepID=UPI003317968B